MDKRTKKILGISLGVLFMALLALVPTIITESIVQSVRLGASLKNKAENFNKQPAPIAAIEPIEKEFFFHFHPGAKTYFLASFEQGLECAGCQEKANRPAPEKIISEAKASDAAIFSTTCSDSAAACDYSFELARKAKDNGLATALSYDGCLGLETFKKYCRLLMLMKIELGA